MIKRMDVDEGHVDSFWKEEISEKVQSPMTKKRKYRKKKKEYDGWGSTSLIRFLESIGRDTSNQMTQSEVAKIVNEYVKQNGLHHPTEKKRIVCDERLHLLFRRKAISRLKINYLLESHFAENCEESSDDIFSNSEDDVYETPKTTGSERKSHPKIPFMEKPRSCFAAIIPNNIKLVYLKKSLVEELLLDPETFETKVVGSFIRIRRDPNDYLQKNPFQLLQVTGIKKSSGVDGEILLQSSGFIKDISIHMLSDVNFSEEECEDLQRRVKDGLLKRPMVVDIEQTARVLHEDMTKHGLPRELDRLQNLIDRANEKGLHRELDEYLQKREKLQSPEEQERLLHEIPQVIADDLESERKTPIVPEIKIKKDLITSTKASSVSKVPKAVADGFVSKATKLDMADHVKQENKSPKSIVSLDRASEVPLFNMAVDGTLSNCISGDTAAGFIQPPLWQSKKTEWPVCTDEHVKLRTQMESPREMDTSKSKMSNFIYSESSSFSEMDTSKSDYDNEQTKMPVIVNKEQDGYEPKIGMIFSNEDEAYDFYNDYAKFVGFTVRKSKYRRFADGSISQRTFVCGREGYRKLKDPSHVNKKNRRETRTGCQAMICFKIEKDAWVVYKFIPNHNHDLVKSCARAMLRSQRHVNEAYANMIEDMDNPGVKPCKVFSYFVEAARRVENVGFLKSDCLQSERSKNRNAGDAQSVINHFRSSQANDPAFVYTMQVDHENRMTNFFWRDGISRIDYNHFGDVVIFDTTYRTNKYNMACAPFIGVNHHKQSVLFGCAFLFDETTESFIWLFESFLEAMGGLQPKTIFTDQCQAMANAIKRVLPESQHRLCLWHIGQNAANHLSYYLGNSDFKVLFNRCLYNCGSEKEFEDVWTRLLTKVDISKCSWLKKIYDLRANWCPAFSKNYFSAGILSTQRSESMNNVFRTVTCKTMSLTQLVLRYEIFLERRRCSELQKDFECNQSTPPRVKQLTGMAAQVARVYTHVIFEEFYEELFESLSVAIEKINESGTFFCYKLVKSGDDKQYFVTFESANCLVECSCKMFESVGLLCLHALKVLNFHNIFHIPSQYILKRWTKDAKDSFSISDNGKQACEVSRQGINLRMSQIMRKAIYFATKGALTNETTKMAEDHLEQGIKSLERMFKNICMMDTTEVDDKISDEEKDEHNKLLDPQCVQARGVTNARLKSQLEKKRCKRNVSQAHNKSQGASTSKSPRHNHVYKGKASRVKDFSTSSTPPPTFCFPSLSQVSSANVAPPAFCFPYMCQVPYTQDPNIGVAGLDCSYDSQSSIQEMVHLNSSAQNLNGNFATQKID
ncbi:protein FAR1-RELATED SEQUENCE 5-like [Gastrolobium bilobum]|uniref:protein FAR1-RELATED SEQUENCE 5-like n=1 Tax=Gastrolobium bilobum TaxID=150636 RepID=UPI002AAF8A37|nr:protein FAR1-RELATED SEQUENCE 5-like [Gastrolobium bilobum]XP_061364287.1 protein FAR1-RELATED SEQUENCE 5-like [Gastrolobium bilobum]XP_061364288.1 protein FAR1-RELATED SEQUENCE 5-like [Gastrolobium bilobum]